MLVSLNSISKYFGARQLFADISLRIVSGDRVALIGPNGVGKSTLLKIIADAAGHDSGEIIYAKGVSTGYLRQDLEEAADQKLLEYVMSSSSELLQIEKQIADLSNAIAENPNEEDLLMSYARATERFEILGGYTYESNARAILFGLGFKDEDMQKELSEFSGGWRMRAELSALLLKNPDVLLLDEPTNHLDLESVGWLESFLRSYEGSLIIVSHDRAFINGVVNKVCDLSPRELRCYKGNYAEYLKARELYFEQQKTKREAQLKEIEHLNTFVERFRYKESKAKAAQEKIGRIEKIKAQLVDLPEVQERMHFRFPQPIRTGKVAIELKGVSKSYGDKKVYENLDLTLYREDKCVLVGPNGAGKSTLMKILAGVVDIDSGVRKLGEHVSISYFSQHQLEILDPKKTVLESLEELYEGHTITETRKLLGAFLFKGDDVFKKVSVLSGGEKSRLALARMLAKPSPLICLDEPTNHLDIYALDVLAKALQDYAGTLILISHDRDLISKVATKLIEVRSGEIKVYDGDYDYYLSKSEQDLAHTENETAQNELILEKQASGKKTKEQKKEEAEKRNLLSRMTRDAKKRVSELDKSLEKLRARQEELTKKMNDVEFYKDSERFQAALKEFGINKNRIESEEEEWIELSEELDEIEKSILE